MEGNGVIEIPSDTDDTPGIFHIRAAIRSREEKLEALKVQIIDYLQSRAAASKKGRRLITASRRCLPPWPPCPSRALPGTSSSVWFALSQAVPGAQETSDRPQAHAL